jgi:DNA-binding CsgD family transcriptional regulator
MPRKRSGTICESLERLEQLERHYEGEPQEIRICVLRLMKEDPARTAADISVITGRPERSIRRWWATYTQKGIDALLELRAGEDERVRPAGPKDHDLLVRKLHRDEFGSLDDVREWLSDHHGVLYSRSEVQFLLHRIPDAEQRWIAHANPGRAGITFADCDLGDDGLVVPAKFIRFLNALPQTDDTNQWSSCFRTALLEVFHDIDHIAVNLNQMCDVTDPESYRPTVVLRQHVATSDVRERQVVVTVDAEEGRPSEEVLKELQRQGRPLNNYHPPMSFDYYYAGRAYLGTIFVFRERAKPPISKATLATIDAMEPFFITAMANHAIWYTQTRPSERIFYDGMERLVTEAGLSVQEQRVAVYHMMGYSYDEMARLLAISTKTVKKHVNTIHRKSGTRRQRELFARYLSPRIDFPDDGITAT